MYNNLEITKKAEIIDITYNNNREIYNKWTEYAIANSNSHLSNNTNHNFELSIVLTLQKIFIWKIESYFIVPLEPSLKKQITFHSFPYLSNSAGIYLLKVSNRNTRTRCEICSKLTIKTPERRQWRRSGVVIVNFEHIPRFALVFL